MTAFGVNVILPFSRDASNKSPTPNPTRLRMLWGMTTWNLDFTVTSSMIVPPLESLTVDPANCPTEELQAMIEVPDSPPQCSTNAGTILPQTSLRLAQVL